MTEANVDPIIDSLRVSPEVLLLFFVTFARFEYALKATNFRKDPPNDAEVSWDKFCTWIENKDSASLRPVLESGQYLLNSPPKKLVITEGHPTWAPAGRNGQSDIRFLIEGIKRARNNLFHGGKWLTKPEPSSRNQDVLTAVLGVLTGILELDAAYEIRREFEAM